MPEDGEYELIAFFVRSWDYGIVTVQLDGEPVGLDFDGYSPDTKPSGPVNLGTFSLKAGASRLRFALDEKHERSAGYFMGLDGLIIKPQHGE